MTAYFPLFDCNVTITHSYKDSNGRALYYVHNAEEGIGRPTVEASGNFIATEQELIMVIV